MALYELKGGPSQKFWTIFLSGRRLILYWDVQPRCLNDDLRETRDFSDAVQARHARDRLIAEKMEEGYTLVKGEEVPVEDGEDTAGGARRNLELEAAIEREPDNLEGYLVYADWLQGQGDPRGELIALQCAAHQATGEEAAALERQSLALIHTFKRFLLGALADRCQLELKLEWRFGFVRSVALGANLYGSDFRFVEELPTFMALPVARFLRELSLGTLDLDEDGSEGYGAIIPVLTGRPGPLLERLFIGDSGHFGPNTPLPCLRDISPLYKAFPQLRVLKLRGDALELGEVELPELREFSVKSRDLPLECVRAIAKAKWPKLERLEVWFGEEDGAGGDEKDLAPLLDGQGVPNLKHLGLCNVSFSRTLCTVLPEAKILRQLESLNLSMGTLTDEDVAKLTRHAAAFQHLKRLDVTENFLSDEGVTRMAALCESVATDHQREIADDEEGF